MKKLSLAFMLVLFALGSALAQRTLMGTITDTEGEALIGANILVKGTTFGTVTDLEEKYKLEVPADAILRGKVPGVDITSTFGLSGSGMNLSLQITIDVFEPITRTALVNSNRLAIGSS